MGILKIAYNSIYACVRKAGWLSMECKASSVQAGFKPVEIQPAPVESGISLLVLGEEVTIILCNNAMTISDYSVARWVKSEKQGLQS